MGVAVHLLAYLAFWMSGRLKPSGGGRLIRIALLIFALTVLLSFVAAMTRDVTGQEVLAQPIPGSSGLSAVPGWSSSHLRPSLITLGWRSYSAVWSF